MFKGREPIRTGHCVFFFTWLWIRYSDTIHNTWLLVMLSINVPTLISMSIYRSTLLAFTISGTGQSAPCPWDKEIYSLIEKTQLILIAINEFSELSACFPNYSRRKWYGWSSTGMILNFSFDENYLPLIF